MTFANPVRVFLGFAAKVSFGQKNVKTHPSCKREKSVANLTKTFANVKKTLRCKRKKNPKVQAVGRREVGPPELSETTVWRPGRT